MSSVGIDTFLKATQATTPARSSAPSEGGGEFDTYLREAESTQRTRKEQPAAKAKPKDVPAQSTNKERDPAKSSDERAKTTVETSKQSDEIVDESLTEKQADADEVLLSVAAIASLATEMASMPETPEVNLEVVIETATADSTQRQPLQEVAADADFLPSLEEALAGVPDAIVDGDAVLPAVPQDTVADSVSPPVVAQVATLQQSEQQATEAGNENVEQTIKTVAAQVPADETVKGEAAETDGDSEQPETGDRKSSKPAAIDKQAVAEQLVAQVTATLTDADSAHDTKLNTTSEAGSTAPVNHANLLGQQAPQAAQVDAQAPQGDQDSRMPTLDRTRFVQRVANAFRSAQQNDGHIQLRLSPPELGSLRIEIAVRHGVLTANLETETADARRVLLDNLPALRQRLAEQDIRIEKFDVDVRREGSPSDGQAGAQDRQAQQQSQRAAAQNRIRPATPTEVISTRVPRLHTASADASLDVRI